MVKNKITQSVNNSHGTDHSNANVISVSGYSQKVSQLNSPIENSSMLDNYKSKYEYEWWFTREMMLV